MDWLRRVGYCWYDKEIEFEESGEEIISILKGLIRINGSPVFKLLIKSDEEIVLMYWNMFFEN
jgi:hypothetical protein